MTEPSGENPSREAHYYLSVLRQRWKVIAACTLAGLLGAGAYLALVPPSNMAASTVNVNAIVADPFNFSRGPSTLLDAQTEVQIAKSAEVLRRARADAGVSTEVADLRSNLDITVFSDATVMRIAYTAASAKDAVAVTDAVAKEYLAFRGNQAADRRDAMLKTLTQRRDDLRTQLVAIHGRLASAKPGSSDALQADADRQVTNSELAALQTQIIALQSLDTSGGTVLSTAGDAPLVVTPGKMSTLLDGLLAGLILGLTLAFVVNVLDRRIRSNHDAVAAGAGAALARLGGRRGLLPAFGEDLDTFRAARERLLHLVDTAGPLLAMVDFTGADQPSDVPVNLALTLAEAAPSVQLVLIDHPAKFVYQAVQTLGAELSTSTATTMPAYRSEDFPGLTVISADSTESSIDALIGDLAATVDARSAADGASGAGRGVVVFALPPNAPHAVRLSVGRLTQTVVLVVAEGRTRIERVAALASDMGAVGAAIDATILVSDRREVAFQADSDSSASRRARKVSTPVA